MPAMARFGSFWSSKVTTSMSWWSSPILTPPFEFHQSASVYIDRTFEVPQAAAGPLVTPTKPIFRTLLAASAGRMVAAMERVETSPRRAARDEVTRVPIMSILPLQSPASLDEGPQLELSND